MGLEDSGLGEELVLDLTRKKIPRGQGHCEGLLMVKLGTAPLPTPTCTLLGGDSRESSGLVKDLAHTFSYSSKLPSLIIF